jgi:hypothetical protein
MQSSSQNPTPEAAEQFLKFFSERPGFNRVLSMLAYKQLQNDLDNYHRRQSPTKHCQYILDILELSLAESDADRLRIVAENPAFSLTLLRLGKLIMPIEVWTGEPVDPVEAQAMVDLLELSALWFEASSLCQGTIPVALQMA